MGSLKGIRAELEREKGRRDSALERLSAYEKELIMASRDLRNTLEAIVVVQTVAKETQSELEYNISELVSLALAAVFDDPYTFKLEFITKRGKTEAEVALVRDGMEVDPIGSSGGGAIDISSFALRIALWNLQSPRSSNTIIMDESFKFLSSDLQPKAGEMLRMLSDKLGIQFITVSHQAAMIESADRVFRVSQKKGVSYVETD